jgi:probable phosphoglycerate mutase
MKHLFIIRHGETEYNKTHRMQGRGIDASLNHKGREQARLVSDFFEEKPITKIITSSLKRSIESAEPLCERFQINAESYSELDEMDFGILEGKPFQEVRSELQFLQEQWSTGSLEIAPKNGENPTMVLKRAASKMEEIIERSNDEYIAFVLHGRLIRILLAEFLGLGLANMHKIEHQNGAINHLTWERGMFRPVSLNIVTHLE